MRLVSRAKEKNGWKPTPGSLLADIEKACVEHGDDGVWNSLDYDIKDIISINIKACYPASFLGMSTPNPTLSTLDTQPTE